MSPARTADSKDAPARKAALPLALIIARYFVYVLAASAALAVVVFAGFVVLIQSGVVYAANHAEEHLSETLTGLSAGDIQPQDLPASYRWAVLDASGKVVASDMDEGGQELAREAALEGLAVVRYHGMGGAAILEKAELPDGGTCVLQYDYLPDFTSRALRDTLPDPQNLMTFIFLGLFVAVMVLIAVRAARVIARKMRPLTEAAAHIERQDLDFAVGMTNVREVNEVLGAMERMRGALEESLHARWAADEARRRQVAALAHDLKTPLSIARWNADLLREGPLDDDQQACSEGLSDSIERMEAYVGLLVETSQADVARADASDVDGRALAEEVQRQAQQLCEACEVELDFSSDFDDVVRGSAGELARAVMNLVANAADHAPARSTVFVRFEQSGDVLRVTVEDEGPGFSAAALAHGTERFYTECGDRGSAAGHFGLGLAIVDDIVHAHGGVFELSNRDAGGARCVIEVPTQSVPKARG